MATGLITSTDVKGALVLSAKIDPKQWQEVQRTLAGVKGAAARAGSQAINDALAGLRTAVSKTIRDTYNFRAAEIKRSISLRKASKRAEAPSGSLTISGKAVSLGLFGARKTKRGVTVLVHKPSGRKLVPGAFPGRAKDSVLARKYPGRHSLDLRPAQVRAHDKGGRWGYVHVAAHTARRWRVAGDLGTVYKDLPKYRVVKKLWGPSVRAAAENASILPKTVGEARVRLADRLAHHVGRELEKAGKA
ncbi:MAG: hypothetical protein KQJ78_20565 [Deltaproteobacteria bacterium]|nr:hypothetical protein [Deltaproteobacteria bacterium]